MAMGITDWFKFDKDEEDEIKLFSNSQSKPKQKVADAKPAKKEAKRPENKAKETKQTAHDSEDEEDKFPIKCRAIVEMLGAPKEYIEKTLKDYIAVMKKTKELKVKSVDTSPTEQKDKLFSLFAEIEMEVKDVDTLVGFCFDYMPSSIEVFNPSHIVFKAHELSNFFNDLQSRLHKLDLAVKELRAQNSLLEKNAGLLLRNNILITLKDKSKDVKTLGKNVGIPSEQLEPFLKRMADEHWIRKVGDEYCLVKPT